MATSLAACGDQNQVIEDGTQPGDQAQPAIRQAVEIPTEDGRALEGYYYPASHPDAPVIVLMHWAQGDLEDWRLIASWLQNPQDEPSAANRGLELASLSIPEASDWLDDSWFPAMPEEASFAVLVFNFGGYGNSAGGRDTLVVDAQAAVRFAASLPGVDPHKIATLGASIGADGAVDGCYLFDDYGEMGTCIGALSLSPNNYITDQFSYTEAVAMLDRMGHPVWCLAAEDDGGSPNTCREASGELYRTFIFPGSSHGMSLIAPSLLPQDPAVGFDTMQLIQEWLEVVFSLSLNDFSLD
jgi:dienelactone hydrolase